MIKYRQEIDGLRTVAIIPVIVFHLDHRYLTGGFFGVDVFFVISGYLISQLIIDDIEKGSFSMYHFWLRRIKRLLPLLLFVLLTTLIAAYFFLFKPNIKYISNDIFPALFSYSNFHLLHNFGDYWGIKAEQSFFLHTWSLSIEEQFYLLYPFFLFLSYKYFKNIIIPILTLTVVSLFLFLYFTVINKSIHNINTSFYMLPTRIWELGIGGLSGIMFSKYQNFRVSKYHHILPVVGLFFILISCFLGIKKLYLLPVIGTSLIIIFCTSNDIIGKLLSTKLFILIGKLSYSLYLWHWILIRFIQNLPHLFETVDTFLINGIVLSTTFLLAYFSYNFIENTTRYNYNTPGIVLAGVTLVVGLTLYLQSNYFKPYYESKYNKQISYMKFYDISPKLSDLNNFINDNSLFYNFLIPERLQKFNDAYKKDGIFLNTKYGNPKIMLIGDSHGVMWAKTIEEISDKLGLSLSSYTSNGSSPFFNVENIKSQEENLYYDKNQRVEYAESIIRNIENWEPKIIILACRWEYYVNKKEVIELVKYLENRKIRVLMLNQPPIFNFMDDKNAGQYFTYLGIEPVVGYNYFELNNQKNVKYGNDFLKYIAKEYKNVTVYDVYKNMTNGNKVKISLDNEIFYFDGDHFSIRGTYEHKEKISKLIKLLIN